MDSSSDLKNKINERGQHRRDASHRASQLREDVASTSSESARIWQTLNHLGGKAAGDAADASIRHRENMKESEAEDQEERARRAGKDVGELGKTWRERFGGK